MTKEKESVKTVEDLKAQVTEMLGLDSMMDEDVVTNMKEVLINQAKSNGEDHIEEVVNTVLKAIEKIKNPEFKGIIASLIWTKCPMGMQESCIELHHKVLRTAMATHMQKQVGNNPLAGLALLAAVLKSKAHE